MPIDGKAFMKPEEIEALKARIARAKHEFSVVYGLKWEPMATFSGARRWQVVTDDLRAVASDHGPLSGWSVEQRATHGWRTIEGGDAIAFEVGVVEAMEALCKVLDARAAAAAEALKDPDPMGFTSLPGAYVAQATGGVAAAGGAAIAFWGAQPAPAMGFTAVRGTYTMPPAAPGPPAAPDPAAPDPLPSSPPLPVGSGDEP
jgi:hypothetical protein